MDRQTVAVEEDGPSREEWPIGYFSQILHELAEWQTGNKAHIKTFHLKSQDATNELGRRRLWDLVIRWSDGSETQRHWGVGCG